MLALQQHDGLPLSSLKAPVDALRFRYHFGAQVVIALDVGAARRAYLHESEFPLIAWILFEEALNRQEALQNALGVVDAVDPNAHIGGFHAQAAQERGAVGRSFSL